MPDCKRLPKLYIQIAQYAMKMDPRKCPAKLNSKFMPIFEANPILSWSLVLIQSAQKCPSPRAPTAEFAMQAIGKLVSKEHMTPVLVTHKGTKLRKYWLFG